MGNPQRYETELTVIENDKLQFQFESAGKTSIVKVIEYSFVVSVGNRHVYNLGFGDYRDGTLIDDVNSNNGDVFDVFYTVLLTVPIFFEKRPDNVIIVSGSDSRTEFMEACRERCRKKCNGGKCKNENRRIRIYRWFIDKNFETLSKDYVFFGRMEAGEPFVQYVPKNLYRDVLIYKKW